MALFSLRGKVALASRGEQSRNNTTSIVHLLQCFLEIVESSKERKNGLETGGYFFTRDKKNDMTDYYQRSAGKIFSNFRSTVDRTLKIVCTNFL